MALYTTLASLSQTAASNVADGAVDAPSTIDQQTNLLASFIARVRDGDRATAVATVASASTVVLDGVASSVDISGTTTITAVTLAEGGWKMVRFSGSLTLTNGASLVLPGAANITTAAGDYAIFVGRASGVVSCVLYQPVSIPPNAPKSLAASGYYKLPGGLIIQWGSVVTTAANTGVTWTFPTAFPNACILVLAMTRNSSGSSFYSSVGDPSAGTTGAFVSSTFAGTATSSTFAMGF